MIGRRNPDGVEGVPENGLFGEGTGEGEEGRELFGDEVGDVGELRRDFISSSSSSSDGEGEGVSSTCVPF